MTDAAWLARIEAKLDVLLAHRRAKRAGLSQRLDEYRRSFDDLSRRVTDMANILERAGHRLDAMEAAWQDHIAAPRPPDFDDNIPF